MNTKKYIIGNWKMALSHAQGLSLATQIKEALPKLKKSLVGVAPSFPSLQAAINILHDTSIMVGSQNVCDRETGAFTGEVSASMLNELGARFAIIGHSERRDYYGETDLLAAHRAATAIDNELLAIFCIGETLEERESNTEFEVISSQLNPLIKSIDSDKTSKVFIAYEPKWAIGTGKVPTTQEISKMHHFIFEYLQKNNCPIDTILYGGSVNPSNFSEIVKIPHVDGALVGGASLKFNSFIDLVNIAEDN